MNDGVSKQRATAARPIRPILDIGRIEETIDDKLSSSFEQPQQIPTTNLAYEFVIAVNFGHRKESALGDQTILGFHQRLFLREQLLAGSVPFIFRNHIEVANGFAHRRSRDSRTFFSSHILLR
jgi:hypothetical protein